MLSIQSLQYSVLYIIVSFWGVSLTAQTFGGFKPSIRWSQIDTDTARIIFPDYLKPEGQRVANAIHYLYRQGVDQIGDKALKIDIVLNNQTTISNGFVSIAPWKSNFVTTPLQDNFQLTSLPWLDLLALHEYRHVVQLSTARRGVVNLLYYLFGEESWAGAVNLSIPGWFTEGDAVWAETEQSGQGRGRISSFLEGYRALKFSDTKYSYQKARNGSLKDFVPDHYRLGYLLVKYGYDHYGEDFWKDVLLDASAYKGIFYPFSRAMKKKSGQNPSSMFENMWKELAEKESRNVAEEKGLPVLIPEIEPKVFTDYQFPHVADDSTLIYFHRSYDRIGKFYSYNLLRKSSRQLITRGVSIDSYFAGSGPFLTWTEFNTDARWTENDYSDIIRYDLQTGIRHRITHKQKYFSPHPTRDGSKIVCAHMNETAESGLKVIDGTTGSVVNEFHHDGWFFTYPQWSQDEKSVLSSVRDTTGKMAIVQIVIDSGNEIITVPFLNRILGVPEVKGEEVYYSASTDGRENIFATNVYTGATRQITDELNGAFQPAVGTKDLYYVTFGKMGHTIKQVDRNQHKQSMSGAFEYEFDADVNLLDSFPGNDYEVKNYNRLAHSFNLHTWGLNIEDPEIIGRVLSNNVLNNVEIAAGIRYNYDEQNYRPFAQVSIAAWYPSLDLQISRLNRTGAIDGVTRNWNETNLFGGFSVDWNFVSKTYFRKISPSIGINQTMLGGDLDLSITSLQGQATLQQQQIKARKNIFTHSGQYLQMRYNRAIDQYLAEQIQVRTGLAFRGVGVNHNLILEADLKSDVRGGDYQFTNGLNHRGLGVIPGEQVFRFSVDYHLPVFYPDWGFGGLIYFFRIRVNPFYEISQVRNLEQHRSYQSVGAELVFDMNAVNEVPISIGIRYAYPLQKVVTPGFELFIPVYRF